MLLCLLARQGGWIIAAKPRMRKTLYATAHIFLDIQLLRLARIREDEMALLEHRALKNAPCALARIVYVLPPAASVGGNNANPQVAGKAKQ